MLTAVAPARPSPAWRLAARLPTVGGRSPAVATSHRARSVWLPPKPACRWTPVHSTVRGRVTRASHLFWNVSSTLRGRGGCGTTALERSGMLAHRLPSNCSTAWHAAYFGGGAHAVWAGCHPLTSWHTGVVLTTGVSSPWPRSFVAAPIRAAHGRRRCLARWRRLLQFGWPSLPLELQ